MYHQPHQPPNFVVPSILAHCHPVLLLLSLSLLFAMFCGSGFAAAYSQTGLSAQQTSQLDRTRLGGEEKGQGGEREGSATRLRSLFDDRASRHHITFAGRRRSTEQRARPDSDSDSDLPHRGDDDSRHDTRLGFVSLSTPPSVLFVSLSPPLSLSFPLRCRSHSSERPPILNFQIPTVKLNWKSFPSLLFQSWLPTYLDSQTGSQGQVDR
ncbi:hypothetical protein LZ31DRAFT_51442 [Colletotrichum somersetense]|nr:hypothetical protein LZ31DRAFT_51442 [Colletotrichum somersetense]